MDRRLNAKLFWRLQTSLAFLGWPGVAALGLLACCLVVYLSALLPAQQRLAEIQAKTGSLRALKAKNQTMQKEIQTPEARLSSFYRSFPAHVATPGQLEKLYAAAAASGIVLEQGDYRLISAQGDKIELYQITLPVRGSYPQIRKFIGRLLADLPAVSLDGVSFQRQLISDTQIDSQLKLTLHLGGGA